ncbi:MAG: hypothetical protein ACYC2E_07015, partial [Sulfuricella sp.]
PLMKDWLPEQHLARFVVEIVEQLDLKSMERAYRRTGTVKTVTLDVRTPSDSMGDFVRAWKTGKPSIYIGNRPRFSYKRLAATPS